jgi:hypothetical protein
MFCYFGASTKLVFSWCDDVVVGHKQRQITPGVWLNKTTNNLADSVGRTASKEKIIMESYSSYQTEDVKHLLGDTMKLVDMMISTLHMDICSKLYCKFDAILELAVLRIQYIKD